MSTLKVDTISPKTSWNTHELAGVTQSTLTPVTSGTWTGTVSWATNGQASLESAINATTTITCNYSLVGNICAIHTPAFNSEGTDYTLFKIAGLPYTPLNHCAFAIGDTRSLNSRYNTTEYTSTICRLMATAGRTSSPQGNSCLGTDIWLGVDLMMSTQGTTWPFFTAGSGAGHR